MNRLERLQMRRKLAPEFFAALLLCLLAVSVSRTPILSPTVFAAPADAGERCHAAQLVRKTINNELTAADADGHYMYRLTRVTPHGSSTEEVIETSAWLVSRQVARNGRPLSADQQRRKDEELRKLLTDPDEREKLKKDLSEQEDRTRHIMQALPDAFIYQCAGSEMGDDGQPEVRLTFYPNPDYDPSSRDLKVLTGMKGKMLIDAGVDRLVRVEATLVRDVDFGWGIFGRLYRGGHFIVEQQAVGQARWAITTLDLQFDGRIFLFKGLHIRSNTTTTDFHHIPDNVTLERAVQMLLHDEPAQTGTTHSASGHQP